MEETTQQETAPNESRNEEWFLAQLDRDSIDKAGLLKFLKELGLEGEKERADSWAELLQETLIERQDPEGTLEVLSLRSAWHPRKRETSRSWREIADRALEQQHDRRKLVGHAGFDKDIPPAEAVRRLRLLLDLKPGTLCMDKTWGFGVVKKTDTFYAKVDIDFERKHDHQLSLSYAGETLQLLEDDHLLARLYHDPEATKAVAETNPAEIVRDALRSFGPLTVAQLQNELIPKLVPADGWKKFWDAARKELKKDSLVDIPTKRTEPMRLLKKEKAYDEEWFDALLQERDMATILKQVEDLLAENGPPQEEAFQDAVGNRLAFVIKGAEGKSPATVALAVMAARDAGVSSEHVDVAARAESFLKPNRFIKVTDGVPAKMIKPVVHFLDEHDRERLVAVLVQVIDRLGMSALSEAIDYLVAAGREDEVARLFRERFLAQTAEVEMLYWVSRNLDKLGKWSLGNLPLLSRMILLDLGNDYSGDRLKTKNQLRARFEQAEFLEAAMAEMTPLQREEALQLVRDSSAWPSLDRQSLLGQMIKLYPELQQLMQARGTRRKRKRGPVTSTRSYVERQKQLEKLVTIDIPANSKEIAIARSYGDLSENHEYKAAKEMQGILLRRRGEIEQMLEKVAPTDFADFPNDVVGPGTGVEIEYEDGSKERFHILGEWDKDEALGIISSETRMAKALEGSAPGDEMTVPSEEGEQTARVLEVTGLPEAVREWLDG